VNLDLSRYYRCGIAYLPKVIEKLPLKGLTVLYSLLAKAIAEVTNDYGSILRGEKWILE
jgi:hypothetical protein